jgi:hypothetical protein
LPYCITVYIEFGGRSCGNPGFQMRVIYDIYKPGLLEANCLSSSDASTETGVRIRFPFNGYNTHVPV